jgi:hypothetical protein
MHSVARATTAAAATAAAHADAGAMRLAKSAPCNSDLGTTVAATSIPASMSEAMLRAALRRTRTRRSPLCLWVSMFTSLAPAVQFALEHRSTANGAFAAVLDHAAPPAAMARAKCGGVNRPLFTLGFLTHLLRLSMALAIHASTRAARLGASRDLALPCACPPFGLAAVCSAQRTNPERTLRNSGAPAPVRTPAATAMACAERRRCDCALVTFRLPASHSTAMRKALVAVAETGLGAPRNGTTFSTTVAHAIRRPGLCPFGASFDNAISRVIAAGEVTITISCIVTGCRDCVQLGTQVVVERGPLVEAVNGVGAGSRSLSRGLTDRGVIAAG